jgi:PleD family two-component response regulator
MCHHRRLLSSRDPAGCKDAIHLMFTMLKAYTLERANRLLYRFENRVPDAQMARILLAEDDEDMRRFLVKALERAGYDVIDYDNGASAYERLREEPFSLLLTDIVMPEMDGIELVPGRLRS